MKFFQKTNMISESVPAAMRTGLYQVGSTNTAVDSGAFVIAGALADNTLYSAYSITLKDFNTFVIKAPVAAEVTAVNANVFVVDPIKVSDGTIASNIYREGAKTLGLGAAAGEKTAIRKLFLNDQFIIGLENFAAAPTVGQYAILTAADTILTAAAAIPATGFAVRVECIWNVSQGINAIKGYLCTVVQL